MDANTRPNTDAVIGTLADPEAVERVLSDLASETSVSSGDIAHGTGERFARQLEGGDAGDDTGAATRLGKWLVSLGQEREELVQLGQAAREGEHAIVINGVEDEATREAVIEILQRHGGARLLVIGDWQSEEIL